MGAVAKGGARRRPGANGRSGCGSTSKSGDGMLDRPTRGTIAAGALYLVNGRFSVADDPSTTFSISRVALR